jgi:hypothetical protein
MATASKWRLQDVMEPQNHTRSRASLLVETAPDERFIRREALTLEQASEIAEEGYRKLIADRIPDDVAKDYRLRTIHQLTSTVSW